MLRVILLATLAAPSAFAQGDVVKQSFEASAVKNLLVEQGQGKVKVIATDARLATVEAKKIKFSDEDCKLEIALEGKKLRVSNKESWKSINKSCHVDFEIHVPKALDAHLKVGAGDVEVAGIKGDLSYELGSGDVLVKNSTIEELDGKSGSGDVSVEGSTLEEGELKIGAGNANVTLAKGERKSKLDVKVGTGRSTIHLPKDATVKSTFKSGLGSLTNEFATSADPVFTISGAAGAGDMDIKSL